jgi:hypothetical protein
MCRRGLFGWQCIKYSAKRRAATSYRRAGRDQRPWPRAFHRERDVEQQRVLVPARVRL